MGPKNASLQALLDREAIAAVILRYCDGMSRREGAVVASCFTDDATIEYDFKTLVGRAEIDAFFLRIRPGMPILGLDRAASTTQLLSNVIITLNGDTAQARSTGISLHSGWSKDQKKVVMRSLSYSDDFVRQGEEWRIRHRRHTPQWLVELPATEIPEI